MQRTTKEGKLLLKKLSQEGNVPRNMSEDEEEIIVSTEIPARASRARLEEENRIRKQLAYEETLALEAAQEKERRRRNQQQQNVDPQLERSSKKARTTSQARGPYQNPAYISGSGIPVVEIYDETMQRQANVQRKKKRYTDSDTYAKEAQRFDWGKVVLGALLFILLLYTFTLAKVYITNFYTNIKYGTPRTSQVDEVVGHDDSPLNKSHFIALNLHGQIEIIEIQGGNAANSKIYVGPNIYDETIPVEVTFLDVNKDGKLDMIVHVYDASQHVYIIMNDGKKFDQSIKPPVDVKV